MFELSAIDVIVCQKSLNGDGKLHFFGQDYNFTRSLCAKIHLWAEINSIVRKRHKREPKQANGDYYVHRSLSIK